MENVLRGPVHDGTAGCDVWTYGPADWRNVIEIRRYAYTIDGVDRWHIMNPLSRQRTWLTGGGILSALAVANEYLEGGKK